MLRAQIKEKLIANSLCSDGTEVAAPEGIKTAAGATITVLAALRLGASGPAGMKGTDTPPSVSQKTVSYNTSSHVVGLLCFVSLIVTSGCSAKGRQRQSFPHSLSGCPNSIWRSC